jgi:hypothetical protein
MYKSESVEELAVETVAKCGSYIFQRVWSFFLFEIIQSNVIKRVSIAVTF